VRALCANVDSADVRDGNDDRDEDGGGGGTEEEEEGGGGEEGHTERESCDVQEDARASARRLLLNAAVLRSDWTGRTDVDSGGWRFCVVVAAASSSSDEEEILITSITLRVAWFEATTAGEEEVVVNDDTGHVDEALSRSDCRIASCNCSSSSMDVATVVTLTAWDTMMPG
jgi:hypothetical protein